VRTMDADPADPSVEVEVRLASAPVPAELAELKSLGITTDFDERGYFAAVTRAKLMDLAAHRIVTSISPTARKKTFGGRRA